MGGFSVESNKTPEQAQKGGEYGYLFDVSMSYVNSGWQERYCQLVQQIEEHLRTNYNDYFAELQMYQTGPMNYVVVAVYRDVPGVREELSKILHYVNEEYRVTVGQNVRRKQILKFDRAKKLYGPKTNGTIDTM